MKVEIEDSELALATAREEETARNNELLDAGAEARYEDEQRQHAFNNGVDYVTGSPGKDDQ